MLGWGSVQKKPRDTHARRSGPREVEVGSISKWRGPGRSIQKQQDGRQCCFKSGSEWSMSVSGSSEPGSRLWCGAVSCRTGMWAEVARGHDWDGLIGVGTGG